jgi:hypothetical protein
MTFIKLKNFYGFLALTATLAATHSMIFPRWPDPDIISNQKLSRLVENLSSNGHIIKSLPIVNSHSDYKISHTPIISFKIDTNSELKLTNFQVRDRKDLEVSSLVESIKPLQLNNSETLSKQPPFYRSQTSSSGSTFQTCFVSGNSSPFGVGADQLTLAVDQLKSVEKNSGIKRFLGLIPSRRYQCMLITLKSTLPAVESNYLWLDLLKQFQITFS